MAKNFSIRFYKVGKHNSNGLSLVEVLDIGNAITPRGNRQKELSAGYHVRLERYDDDAGDLTGEFTRVKTDDFPYEADSNAALPFRLREISEWGSLFDIGCLTAP